MATAELSPQSQKHDHDHGHDLDHVAHHFESAQQQFDAGKLGMWLFLVTEILFFSTLFVLYAVYRSNHPEVFVGAHKYLNTTLGALNTIVLLVSSLTMAWAVRSAQLNQKKSLVALLTMTLACASFFLGVKAVEYSHKFEKGLLWAGAYAPVSSKNDATASDLAAAPDHDSQDQHASHTNSHKASSGTFHFPKSLLAMCSPFALLTLFSLACCGIAKYTDRERGRTFWLCMSITAALFFAGVVLGQVVESVSDHSKESVAQNQPMQAKDGLTTATESQSSHNSQDSEAGKASDQAAETAKYTGVFFSIYYAMTGVHAIHILAGMGVIAWLLWRAIKEDFHSNYFGPVDFVALYWHLVDLVWIYLFPLLYLIR